tara:strand:- start:326 stop:721 length:396 start_codon:yes stop_codon:yes gene_type:complete
MNFEKENLTKNQKIVLNLLENSKEPLKAYTILSDTQKKGIKAPTQVYRALDKLISIGRVHKIESKNSYIACNHAQCNSLKSTSFLICKDCDTVIEIEKSNFTSYFASLSEKFDFKHSEHNLEIYGLCNICK